MATVKPFKAVRATHNKVALVSSKSYGAYTPKELYAKLASNPYTFLHVVHQNSIDHQKNVISKLHFQRMRDQYVKFKKKGYLIQDEIPAFYLYQQITPTHSYCGIIATTSVEDYYTNVIKKHENTLHQREVLFENYLKNTRFSASPVLLTYPDHSTITTIVEKYKTTEPVYEFTTTDKNVHVLWILQDPTDIQQIIEAFKTMSTLYIADGHHRSTSSCMLAKNLAKQNTEHTGNEAYNFFMSYLLPESQVCIYEFNRFIKDLNGLTVEAFLTELNTVFTIENKGQQAYKPNKKHHFSMYLAGNFYALALKKVAYQFTDELSQLDAQILYTTVLQPILGIDDIRNSAKIRYSQNKSGSLELKTKVDEGSFKVAFGMLATNIQQLKNIVDAGLIMPPKTTYIEPKLRSALTIYEI